MAQQPDIEMSAVLQEQQTMLGEHATNFAVMRVRVKALEARLAEVTDERDGLLRKLATMTNGATSEHHDDPARAAEASGS